MKVLKLKIVIFLGIPLLLVHGLYSYPFVKSFSGECTRVIDGDTIIVDKKVIRLKYIDAPEKEQKSLDSFRIGRFSKDVLSQLVLGHNVKVKYFAKGKYKRIIGVVWLKDREINLAMIEKGAAVISPYANVLRYRSAEFDARINRRGIFKTLGFVSPWKFRKLKTKATN